MKKKSVLIIGSGPAGVSSAFFLKWFDKKNVFDILMVERLDQKKYEMYHDMCGEGVGASLFRELYPLQPDGIIEKVTTVREYWPGEIVVDTHMDGYLINRTKFLGSIIHKFEDLGGVFENRNVKGFSQKNDKLMVDFGDHTREFDYLIAADGANSMVRKSLGAGGRTQRLLQYIVDNRPKRGILEFYWDEIYEGNYKWVFPHEGKEKIGYPALENKTFVPDGEILQKQSRFVAFGGLPRYTFGRILLVGDAACQTNPMSKGGIRPGMIAGRMAARALVKNKPDLYDRNWKKSHFASDVFLTAFLKFKTMNNSEFIQFIEPFQKYGSGGMLSKAKLLLRLMTQNRQYSDIYRASDLANKFGW
jgi:flavin-dependent dehydrogenase